MLLALAVTTMTLSNTNPYSVWQPSGWTDVCTDFFVGKTTDKPCVKHYRNGALDDKCRNHENHCDGNNHKCPTWATDRIDSYSIRDEPVECTVAVCGPEGISYDQDNIKAEGFTSNSVTPTPVPNSALCSNHGNCTFNTKTDHWHDCLCDTLDGFIGDEDEKWNQGFCDTCLGSETDYTFPDCKVFVGKTECPATEPAECAVLTYEDCHKDSETLIQGTNTARGFQPNWFLCKQKCGHCMINNTVQAVCPEQTISKDDLYFDVQGTLSYNYTEFECRGPHLFFHQQCILDVSQITTFEELFRNCKKNETIQIDYSKATNWDVAHVQNMYATFRFSTQYIDLRTWDFSSMEIKDLLFAANAVERPVEYANLHMLDFMPGNGLDISKDAWAGYDYDGYMEQADLPCWYNTESSLSPNDDLFSPDDVIAYPLLGKCNSGISKKGCHCLLRLESKTCSTITTLELSSCSEIVLQQIKARCPMLEFTAAADSISVQCNTAYYDCTGSKKTTTVLSCSDTPLNLTSVVALASTCSTCNTRVYETLPEAITQCKDQPNCIALQVQTACENKVTLSDFYSGGTFSLCTELSSERDSNCTINADSCVLDYAEFSTLDIPPVTQCADGQRLIESDNVYTCVACPEGQYSNQHIEKYPVSCYPHANCSSSTSFVLTFNDTNPKAFPNICLSIGSTGCNSNFFQPSIADLKADGNILQYLNNATVNEKDGTSVEQSIVNSMLILASANSSSEAKANASQTIAIEYISKRFKQNSTEMTAWAASHTLNICKEVHPYCGLPLPSLKYQVSAPTPTTDRECKQCRTVNQTTLGTVSPDCPQMNVSFGDLGADYKECLQPNNRKGYRTSLYCCLQNYSRANYLLNSTDCDSQEAFIPIPKPTTITSTSKTTTTTTITTLNECPSGNKLNRNDNTCVACPAGKYSNSNIEKYPESCYPHANCSASNSFVLTFNDTEQKAYPNICLSIGSDSCGHGLFQPSVADLKADGNILHYLNNASVANNTGGTLEQSIVNSMLILASANSTAEAKANASKTIALDYISKNFRQNSTEMTAWAASHTLKICKEVRPVCSSLKYQVAAPTQTSDRECKQCSLVNESTLRDVDQKCPNTTVSFDDLGTGYNECLMPVNKQNPANGTSLYCCLQDFDRQRLIPQSTDCDNPEAFIFLKRTSTTTTSLTTTTTTFTGTVDLTPILSMNFDLLLPKKSVAPVVVLAVIFATILVSSAIGLCVSR